MKPLTQEQGELLSAELHEARAFLDRVIIEAHSFGLLGVAVECFLAQANLDAALQRLEVRRLEASAKSAGIGLTANGLRDNPARPALRAWEYEQPNGGIGVCAWCQSELGVKPERGQSHGICRRHQEFMLAEMGRLTGRDRSETSN